MMFLPIGDRKKNVEASELNLTSFRVVKLIYIGLDGFQTRPLSGSLSNGFPELGTAQS